MTKKTIAILLFSAVGIFFIWTSYLWKVFACGIAGSYPCVETWSLHIKEPELLELIKEIKQEHPELEPPNVSYPTSRRHSYWYLTTFHYPDTKENIQTWTRENEDAAYTTLALVSIATHIDSLTPKEEIRYDSKDINRDYSYFANKKEIKKFKTRILSLIESKIHEKRKRGYR